MGGLSGVVTRGDCIQDLFFGTDYHSHLGTMRGGLAVKGSDSLRKVIHNIENAQFKDTIQRLYDCGAKEVHMRPACPPLVYSCKFLNFSRSRSELDLAARKAIQEVEGRADRVLDEYADPDSERHAAMVERIRQRLRLTTLKYQRLPDLVEAIGLSKEKLCTYCWDGAE